jgi:hypothetical protein
MSKSAVRPQSAKQNQRTLSQVKAKASRNDEPSRLPSINPWIALGVFVILDLIFHWSLIFGDRFLWEDFVEQEFPFRNLATTSLANGVIPHWNPYIFGGMPFTADIQVGFWYPTNLLQSLFVSGGYLASGVMQFFILIHYAVAGFGMWLFVRRIFKVDDWSALLAGVSYMFCGFIVAQANHQMIVYHMALFPLVAYLFFRGFNCWKHAIAAGLMLGVMYLGGHPQSTLFFTLFLAVAAVYEIVRRAMGKSEEKLNATSAARMAVPVVIALGIFAIQLMPSQELADLSRRDVITYEKSVEGSLTWGHLLTFVMPRMFGVSDAMQQAKVPYWNGPYYLSWETALYIGVLPLFFALVAAAFGWKRKYVPLFAGMGLFAVLFALGDNFFLYKIFFNFPLFDRFRTPARMVMVSSFALSALSAVGLHYALTSRLAEKRGLLIGAAVSLIGVWLLAILGTFSASSFVPGIAAQANESISWAASSAAIPVIALVGVLFLLLSDRFRGFAAVLAVVAITAIELFTYGQGLNESDLSPEQQYRQQPELLDLIKKEQATEVSRARTRLGNTMLLKRNQGAYDKIQLIEGYNPLVLQRVSPETANPEAQADLMNMKWSILGEGREADFQPRPTYLPRAKMYYRGEVLADEQAKHRLKTDANFDYRNVIILEGRPSLEIGKEDPDASVKMLKYGTDAIELEVTTKENGILFLSEVYYPAWKAYVGGKPAKVHRAFTTLRAVEVPKGVQKVVLHYESDAFATGSMITLATLIGSLGALGFLMIRRSKKREEAAEETSSAV